MRATSARKETIAQLIRKDQAASQQSAGSLPLGTIRGAAAVAACPARLLLRGDRLTEFSQ